MRCRTLCTSSGEPSRVQIAAYFFADCVGRTNRITPYRIGFHTHARDLDDARIGEELREVPAHRRRRGRVRRPQVGQQYADARRAVVGERRFRSVSHEDLKIREVERQRDRGEEHDVVDDRPDDHDQQALGSAREPVPLTAIAPAHGAQCVRPRLVRHARRAIQVSSRACPAPDRFARTASSRAARP